MSDLQFSPKVTRTLAPEWDALGRLGQAFSVIWLWIALFLLYLFGVYMTFSTLVPQKLMDANPNFCLEVHHRVLNWSALYGLIVFILLLIRMWATPESIVPGRNIARLFVLFLLLDVAIIWTPLVEITGLVSLILFLIYLWQLAGGIGSRRVKCCVICESLGLIVLPLLILAEATDLIGEYDTAMVTKLIGVCGWALGIMALATFYFLAKDIKVFIKNNRSDISKPSDQQAEPEITV
ncbi:MAG: hypothetical protein IJK97_06095 [Thermoguttaceae bacterium]|nr:hypothetical protein [Thermoguttaceae bacterium]MBR0193024.1 hypothetical protein [Thermoguttaceae bacterium]